MHYSVFIRNILTNIKKAALKGNFFKLISNTYI